MYVHVREGREIVIKHLVRTRLALFHVFADEDFDPEGLNDFPELTQLQEPVHVLLKAGALFSCQKR